VSVALAHGRRGWVQVARGAIEVNGTRMQAGDGAAITQERELKIEAKERAEVLAFDLGL
jgi:redox-sensitive bicupin YhaK (pirin superfamily)